MPESIRKFAIFYEDGSVVEGGGEDDEYEEITIRVSKKWLQAPNDGIQAVIEENPYTCRYVWKNEDYYYMLPEGHTICCTSDLGSYLRVHLKGLIKFGTCTTDENLQAIFKKIYWYDRIPRKCQQKENPIKNAG